MTITEAVELMKRRVGAATDSGRLVAFIGTREAEEIIKAMEEADGLLRMGETED